MKRIAISDETHAKILRAGLVTTRTPRHGPMQSLRAWRLRLSRRQGSRATRADRTWNPGQ
jgi:hypothetical protein